MKTHHLYHWSVIALAIILAIILLVLPKETHAQGCGLNEIGLALEANYFPSFQ